MRKDVIIVGQGVCGTFLHWYLSKLGLDILVIDEYNASSSTRVAAGMINPITGRRLVKSWMVDDIHPFSSNAYTELGNELGITGIHHRNIIDFFPNPQMLLAFNERAVEEPAHLRKHEDENHYRDFFHYDFGFGEIHPGYVVNTTDLFPAYRKKLQSNGSLIEERFDAGQLQFNNEKAHYKDIIADRIIFCEGLQGMENKLFPNLPFGNNKGQALIVEIDDLPTDKVYKKTMKIVPVGEKLFWVGASYEWNYTDLQPTEDFRKKTEETLKHWLKLPFRVADHKASVRPATLERRPFVGFHPANPALGILNGMGTKGFSLGPYFAHELAQHIVHRHGIHPLADVSRFEKTLARSV